MRLLLDTHALLWWLGDDGQLGPAARELIAEPANDVLVSAASLWEIAVKVRIGKLRAEVGEIAEAVGRVLDEPGLARDLRSLGEEHARGFTWHRTAELTAAALRRRP